MAPTVSAQLRDIAGTLRAYVEEGEFDDCDTTIAADMLTLPLTLERIAKRVEDAAKLGGAL
jgi:hypothetical protein